MSYSPQPYPENGGLTPTGQERNWAGLAHLGSIVAASAALGLVAPLIVLLIKGNQSPYIRKHAVESLNFQITIFIWSVVGVVLALATLGIGLIVIVPIAIVVGLCYLIVVIIAGIKALNGGDFRYPLTFRFVS